MKELHTKTEKHNVFLLFALSGVELFFFYSDTINLFFFTNNEQQKDKIKIRGKLNNHLIFLLTAFKDRKSDRKSILLLQHDTSLKVAQTVVVVGFIVVTIGKKKKKKRRERQRARTKKVRKKIYP